MLESADHWDVFPSTFARFIIPFSLDVPYLLDIGFDVAVAFILNFHGCNDMLFNPWNNIYFPLHPHLYGPTLSKQLTSKWDLDSRYNTRLLYLIAFKLTIYKMYKSFLKWSLVFSMTNLVSQMASVM